MAQAGLHIPAHQGSQLPIFDDVLADIGDEQSLEQSLSTFSSHVRRVSSIFAKATERSLVLMDEMGAGTDPAEGAALGRSILDEIDSVGCLAIVTTHIGDLKTYAFTNPRAENAAVEFDLETLRPRYRLHIGDIGQSNALQIARRLNLPEHLVARASKYLLEGQGKHLPEMEIVQKLRKDAEDARQQALAAQAEADRSREALNQRLGDLQKQAENDSTDGRGPGPPPARRPRGRPPVRLRPARPDRQARPAEEARHRLHRHDEVGRGHRRADPPDDPHARDADPAREGGRIDQEVTTHG